MAFFYLVFFFINVCFNLSIIWKNVDFDILKFFIHQSSSYSLNKNLENQVVLLSFTQYPNSYDKTPRKHDKNKSWIEATNKRNYALLTAIERSMAKQSKFEKKASRIGELKIWSISWNNAIHPMMKITHSCVLSMACYNMKW